MVGIVSLKVFLLVFIFFFNYLNLMKKLIVRYVRVLSMVLLVTIKLIFISFINRFFVEFNIVMIFW